MRQSLVSLGTIPKHVSRFSVGIGTSARFTTLRQSGHKFKARRPGNLTGTRGQNLWISTLSVYHLSLA